MIAAKLIAYIGTLTVTQGRMAGQRLPVFPWERRFIRGAFAEGVVDSAISVGRGNGKTTLVAALACAAIDGPLAYPRAGTVVVASSFDQSKITFNHVLAFLREKYGADLEDKSLWRIQDSANRAHITNRTNDATLKCIGSDLRRAHGLVDQHPCYDGWNTGLRSNCLKGPIRHGRGPIASNSSIQIFRTTSSGVGVGG